MPSAYAIMPCVQVGEERSIVSAMSGTTRDAIDTEVILFPGCPHAIVHFAPVRDPILPTPGQDRGVPCLTGTYPQHACTGPP